MRVVARVATPLLLLAALAAFGGESRREDDARARDDDAVPLADDEGMEDDVDPDAPADVDPADDVGEGEAADSKAKSRSGCPKDMARVGTACIDRYEAPNKRGGRPLVMQTSMEAEAWCATRHKRLCAEDEWVAACEGSQKRSYPYGASHEDGRCNDDKEWRQVNETVLAKWPADEAKEHNKSLYQAAKSGSKRLCKSEVGVYDLTGNVEEWVVRTRSHTNDYHHILVGCYWSGCYGGGKPTCTSSNSAHGPGFRFYETGFRCCKDATRRR